MKPWIPAIWISILLLIHAHTPSASGADPTPAEKYQTLLKEFQAASQAYFKDPTEAEMDRITQKIASVSEQFLQLALSAPKDPVAFDSLVQVITQEIWLENNSLFAGRVSGEKPVEKAVEIMLQDYLPSERMAEVTRRAMYGFGPGCETLLRRALEKSPHPSVQGLACLRLAQFLEGRLHRLDLLKDRGDMVRRYEGLFGKEFVKAQRQMDPAPVRKEMEQLLERAITHYEAVKLPYGESVGEVAKLELNELKNLVVGLPAPDTSGPDQDGKEFKLSDYRGKIVLLYFWTEY